MFNINISHLINVIPNNSSNEYKLHERVFYCTDLIVNIKYHQTSHSIGFYITASYERLLRNAKNYILKAKYIYNRSLDTSSNIHSRSSQEWFA